MRRRRDAERLSPARLLRDAAAAGVDEMSRGDRRAWLNARGWTSLDLIRAQLAQRRADHCRGGAR